MISINDDQPSLHCSINSVESVEFWVGNAKSFVKCYLQPLQYKVIGIFQSPSSTRTQYVAVNKRTLEALAEQQQSNGKTAVEGGELPTLPYQSILVTTSVRPGSDQSFYSMLQSHSGDFVKSVTFNCHNVKAVHDNAVSHGAISIQSPSSSNTTFGKEIKTTTSTIQSPFKDITHSFVSRSLVNNNNNNNNNNKNNNNIVQLSTYESILKYYYPQFRPITKELFKEDFNDLELNPAGQYIHSIDHIATCIVHGTMDEYVKWYQDCLKFNLLSVQEGAREEIPVIVEKKEELNFFNIKVDEDIGLKMVVLSNQPAHSKSHLPTIMWVMSEGFENGKGQVEQYLDFNGGSGIQHLAFNTSDIYKAVNYARSKYGQMEFIEAPDTYYDNLKNRKELDFILSTLSQCEIDNLKTFRILIDSDYSIESIDKFILQIFTKPIGDSPTLFFELVQRCGAIGFGKGNIKALFEAVEMQRKKDQF
ncbi:4-hydroxyphenylpyruvate dioxygenase-like protein [Cavenderia fasciculata]|uniref:4-hydroxyphenylpyruvate dioxygenase-like protein n=1 Tax=Cavenderia fasciculata TaxID=261658 RepID=F4PGG7_CACFS|nr:4-hydroxyphenylpyruvate dioxygenase-like protein [Cavenderia fasciculata]EGG24801.1 4-hydroxyphenylpyruvate dioxygenase-like protein [Cavenderia fasciculata]|eukprot:XP_004362652.1 4-hydroxyphenylpyruvate dioxygenase-like protein [Cavenderia fasciculata]